jgi:molybdenum cofactor cytidylyltransferase
MEFGPVPVAQAEGHVLGHNVTDPESGRRLLRKGRTLTPADLEVLASLGRATVYVARVAGDDVLEDLAAARIAAAAGGDGLRPSAARTGRVNLYAREAGLLRVAGALVLALNRCRGVALATLPPDTPVAAERMVATLKVVPYALPEPVVRNAEEVAARGPLLALTPFRPTRVALILHGGSGSEERLTRGYLSALAPRLEALRSKVAVVDFLSCDDGGDEVRLAEALRRRLDEGPDLVLLAGETAIMDRADVAPRAVARAGGMVVAYGAPVDPGNLLMLGYRNGVPIVGAPGCARSPKRNIVDLVLPRLLAGDRLEEEDLWVMGPGGLLEDVPERPLPRSRIE